MVQWSDRKKKVQVPLFSSYIFVYLNIKEISKVFGIPGVVRFLSTRGKKDIVPEKDIETIRTLVSSKLTLKNEDFSVGEDIVVCEGPLTGLRGRFTNKKGKSKLVICLSSINKNVSVEISTIAVRSADVVQQSEALAY